MKPTQRLGAAILVAVLAVALVSAVIPPDPDPKPTPTATPVSLVTVHGRVGNLKVPFFDNPDVQRILRDKYGLEVQVTGSGTREITCPKEPALLDDIDFLWVGEQSQIPEYEQCQSRHDPWRNIFLSPMVIYSWADIIEALMKDGEVRQDANGAYYADMPKLLALLESGRTWNDLGFEHRPNDVKVYVTDTDLSSSGRSFAALLSDTMDCLEVVDASTVDTVLPSIFEYYQRVGYVYPSSAQLFESYLTLGPGALPMVALIESQISEYLYAYKQSHTEAQYQAQLKLIRDNVRMIYPEPTLWTSHPVIARTDAGKKVMEALLDPDLQQLGWEVAGFRPAVAGVTIDPSTSPVPGILPVIESVIDMPGDAVMAQIKDATKNDPGPGKPRRDCSGVAPEVSPAASVAAT